MTSVSVLLNYDLCFSEIINLNMEVGSGPFSDGLFYVLSYTYFQDALPFNLLVQATFENKVSLGGVFHSMIIA